MNQPKVIVRSVQLDHSSDETFCRCSPTCDIAIQFINPANNEIERIFCRHSARKLGFDILRLSKRKTTGDVNRENQGPYARDGKEITPQSWDLEEEQRLVELFLSEVKINKIAAILGRKPKSVEHKLGVMRKKGQLNVRRLDNNPKVNVAIEKALGTVVPMLSDNEFPILISLNKSETKLLTHPKPERIMIKPEPKGKEIPIPETPDGYTEYIKAVYGKVPRREIARRLRLDKFTMNMMILKMGIGKG